MSHNENYLDKSEAQEVRKLLIRYISFWPYIISCLIISIFIALLYIRYTPNTYKTTSTIEIIDKSMDSEMALPTAMTIFNRSMINLDNEIGRISSFSLNSVAASNEKSNIQFFKTGSIKSTMIDLSELDFDVNIEYKIDTDTITEPLYFKIFLDENELNISFDDHLGNSKSYKFESLSTFETPNKLPFNISFDLKEYNQSKYDFDSFDIHFLPFEYTVDESIKNLKIGQTKSFADNYGGSDQLVLEFTTPNKIIGSNYLNKLINVFDSDGVMDRQLEYRRTIDFVDKRSIFLEKELEQIENRKKEFKIRNKLTDVESNASFTISQQFTYDSELFKTQSQKDLLSLLKDELLLKDNTLLPVNIGIENQLINDLIVQYNSIVKDRERFLNTGAGPKNSYVLNLDSQLDGFYQNIINSVDSYKKSLELEIERINLKENEYEDFYLSLPENEKILRSIERELEIKEALFLLLLQKKEEASINLAVVKPTIKVIDYSRSDKYPVSPNKNLVFIVSFLIGLGIPVGILSLRFFLDNKIHTKDQLKNMGLPVLAEIPYIKKFQKNLNVFSNERSIIAESMRILTTNIEFVLNRKNNKVILVTSTIKGEGKTFVSTNLSKILSKKNNVLLIGADLRNPQIHSYFGLKKNHKKGLSDYLAGYENSWEELVFKNESLNIILSGTIPPNPTDLLSQQKFYDLLDQASKNFDYVILDTAPCLLVADTLQFTKEADVCISVTRANYSTNEILNYMSDNIEKYKNLCLVLNSVGNSQAYGYKYGYQYGYQYGYGYGYGSSKE